MSKQGTRKVNVAEPQVYQQQMLNPDNYLEKPRPNFYNVIKKLREPKVQFLFFSTIIFIIIAIIQKSALCCQT
jgi:hypothetical protein